MVLHLFSRGDNFNCSMSPAKWKNVYITESCGELLVEIRNKQTGEVLNRHRVDSVLIEDNEEGR